MAKYRLVEGRTEPGSHVPFWAVEEWIPPTLWTPLGRWQYVGGGNESKARQVIENIKNPPTPFVQVVHDEFTV